MRYTTIIDISQCQDIYRNQNSRLVYLHLVIKAGYHDHDRDLGRISIRSLAADTGLTISAVRNAIKQLVKWKLLARVDDMWAVRKWVPEQPITTREKSARQQRKEDRQKTLAEERERRHLELELEQKKREATKTERDQYIVFVKRQQELAKAGDLEAQEWLRKHPASRNL